MDVAGCDMDVADFDFYSYSVIYSLYNLYSRYCNSLIYNIFCNSLILLRFLSLIIF